jgi:hypothetical protein
VEREWKIRVKHESNDPDNLLSLGCASIMAPQGFTTTNKELQYHSAQGKLHALPWSAKGLGASPE